MTRRIETIAAHAGGATRTPGEPVAPPISLSTTFLQSSPGEYEDHAYGRIGNPSRDGLEDTLAKLEGGDCACAFSSGCAAMDAALRLLSPGDHLVACADVYGGTYRLIERLVAPLGVRVSWVDMSDVACVEEAITKDTSMVWVETPTNPLLRVFDVEAISACAHRRGAVVVVDSTFASPYLQHPLSMGADIVVHSLSKYINGHSDVVSGVLVMNEGEIAKRIRFIQRAGGAVPSPFDCYLVARGIKTLPVRMERHCDNAMALARWLTQHRRVELVHYPGLPEHPDHELAERQMRRFGGMVSFVVEGGLEAASDVLSRVRVFALAESLGGVESLIGQPALMSHASMPRSVREQRGVRDGLIRLSVGLEALEDLRDDLGYALGTT